MYDRKAIILLILTVVVLFATAYYTGAKLDDLEQDAKVYCKNVHDKVWPDYKQAYAESCNPDGTWKGN